MSKKYGLIVPNKKNLEAPVIRHSIFDDDTDLEEPAEPAFSKPTGMSKTKKQDVLNQQKALEEDPTVYQYDEVYDEIANKKKESKLARKDIDRKPKYINKLLAAADRRKRENEKRIIRQVQQERETEGEQFNDKESFITPSYKKKLEEMKELEEREKREEYLESIGDVTKQGNLDGFYRHLYDQKVNYEDETDVVKIKEEATTDDDEDKSTEIKNSEAEKRPAENENKEPLDKKSAAIKRRKYRSRNDSETNTEELEDSGNVEIKKEHLPSNLDADSDFSVDSSSDSDEEKEKAKDLNTTKKEDESIEHEGEKLKLPTKGNVLSDNATLAQKTEDVEDELKPKEEKKPKIDIWKKRTVGELYDDAIKRYFERKASRGW